MHLVFDDHDTRILGSVDDERVRAVQDDIVTIARIEHHERVTTAECPRPSGENISKLEFSVVGDGIKIVVAIDETDHTLLDYAEERVEPREGRVLWIGHLALRLSCEGRAPSIRIVSKPPASSCQESVSQLCLCC